jgi:hypothetical protein
LALGHAAFYGRDYPPSELFRVTVHPTMLSLVHLCCNALLQPYSPVGAAVDLRPEEVSRRMLSMLLMETFVLAIPVSIGIAVLRARLFDIGVIINRTLVYGPLTATLIAIYFGGIVVLQRFFVALTGEQSTLAVVASTLLIAALFNPLRRRIQAFIDRRFYRRKYDAIKTLEDFSAKLRDETNLEVLNDKLVGVVRETMQPAHVSLWLRPDTASRGKSSGEKP